MVGEKYEAGNDYYFNMLSGKWSSADDAENRNTTILRGR